MDNKDLIGEEELNNTSSQENAQASNEPQVNYEENDNWKFEAEAPSLSDELFETAESETETEAETETSADDTAEEPVSQTAEVSSEKAEDEAVNAEDEAVNAEETLTEQAAEPAKKSKKLLLIPAVLIAVVLIAVVVFFTVRFFTTPKAGEKHLNPASVVMTVGDQKVSVGMFEYYYSSIVTYYEQYAAYGYYNLDTSSDYSTQYTTDDDGNEVTWEEFFKQEALEEARNVVSYYDLAVKNGITLTDAQKELIDTQIDGLKETASNDEKSLDQYITENFGPHCNEDTLRLMLEQYFVSTNYKGMFNANTQVTDDEINAYYEAHKSDFEEITFTYIAIPYDTTSEQTIAESDKKIADYESQITDRDSVVNLVPTVYAEYIAQDSASAMESDSSLSEEKAIESATQNYIDSIDYTISQSSSPFSEDVTNWLFSTDTALGSVNHYIDQESGYAYIILKSNDTELDTTESYSVRHILITPESDTTDAEDSEQTEFTEAQWAAAEAKANDVLNEYNASDKTEYAFALLAEKYTADTASTSTGSNDMFGGLYEGVSIGNMVPEFESWATDKSRKYGDTGIVKSDYGYHIMFFVYDTETYKTSIIMSVRSEKLDAEINELEIENNDKNIDRAISLSKKYSEKLAASAVSDENADNSAETVQE